MNKETDLIRAEIKGLRSPSSINRLWDRLDREIDDLFERSKLVLPENRGAALAVFALGCRNPHDLDATDEQSQLLAERDQ